MIRTQPLLRKSVFQFLIIGFLFVMAFGLRLYHIGEPPMDFQEVRQYHGALLARGFYEWWLTGELKTLPPDGIIEPPILEFTTSFAYYAFGGEYLWVPRLLSALFWMIGGVFLYLIAKKITSPSAALLSLLFYLFVPFSVLPSRAFMPESLMIMMLLVSLFTILLYHERPSARALAIAATASSVTLFIKPGFCFFQIIGAFALLAILKKGIRKSVTDLHLLVFVISSILPVGLYYLYGTFIEGFLQGQAQDKLEFALLLQLVTWSRWLDQIVIVVGYVALLGALVGLVLSRRGAPRALLSSLWVGYFLFGLVFTLHIRSHDYYSLQLIPVVALSLSPLASLILTYISQRGLRSSARIAILVLFVMMVVLSTVEHRDVFLGIAQQAQGKAFPGRYMGQTTIANYEGRAKVYQEIGEIVNHSSRTLFLAPEFGFSLMYHGRLSGEAWPGPGPKQPRGGPAPSRAEQRSTEKRFNALYSEHSPDYFIVVSRFTQRNRKADFWKSEEYEGLKRLLTENFPVVVVSDDFIVFDLRKARLTGEGQVRLR